MVLTRAASLVADIADAGSESSVFKVHRIVGDGKCMFRATVRALAVNKGAFLSPAAEKDEAEALRIACYNALCMTSHRRRNFPDAEKQIRFGEGLGCVCVAHFPSKPVAEATSSKFSRLLQATATSAATARSSLGRRSGAARSR